MTLRLLSDLLARGPVDFDSILFGPTLLELTAQQKLPPPPRQFPDFEQIATLGLLQHLTGIRTRPWGWTRTPQQRYRDKLTQHREAIGRRVWHTKARLVATGQWYNPTPQQRAELRRKARP